MISGPTIRQLDLPPIEQADGKHLVALREQVQRPLPARHADEIRDHEDERAALDRALAGHEQWRQVGERRLRQARLPEQIVDEAENLDPPAASRDRALDTAAVEDRADAVAVACQQPRERRHEIDEDAPLHALRLRGPEVDRRAQVEQEPRGDLAILDVLADVRRVHPGGDVPVDVADVVTVLVLAQIGEVHAVAGNRLR